MTLLLLRTFLCSLAGTFVFAMLLHAPKRSWLISGLLGGLGFTVYTLALLLGLQDAAAMFLGALLASSLAQLAARRMRMIATIFVTLSIIPCVPGLGLYRSMSLLASNETAAGVDAFVTAMTEILMIALALAVSSFFARRRPTHEVK